MRLKFFPSAAVIISAGALLVVPGGRLAAQQPPATPAKPSPARLRMGHVRFWNLTPPTGGITLELVAGSIPEAPALTSAPPANYYASYVPEVPGSYALKIYRAGNRQQVIKSFDLVLKDRSYFTLLATQEPDGRVSVELVDDTPDPTKEPKNRLTIRQFCQDTSVVVVTSGNFKSDSLPYGKTATLEGLPNGNVALSVRAVRTGNAAVKTWDTVADFRVSHHSTLFIVNDLYGRIRARVAMDGPSPEEEAAAAAEAKGNP